MKSRTGSPWQPTCLCIKTYCSFSLWSNHCALCMHHGLSLNSWLAEKKRKKRRETERERETEKEIEKEKATPQKYFYIIDVPINSHSFRAWNLQKLRENKNTKRCDFIVITSNGRKLFFFFAQPIARAFSALYLSIYAVYCA